MKIICIGHNYRDHNKEMGREELDSKEPVIFMKPESALLTNEKRHFYIPDFTSNVHYEAEIVVRVEKMGKNIAERFAHRYYNEITIGLDLTARDLQDKLKSKGLPWEISKGFDNSAVIGNLISVENLNIQDLNFSLQLNDKKVQVGNTSQMIHSIDQIIAYVSRFFTLKTGDLIFTGTPAGVGKVEIGDELSGFIEGDKLLELKIC